MTPTFGGQAVLGSAIAMTASIYAGGYDALNSLLGYSSGTWRYPVSGRLATILVNGTLTGSTTPAVAAAQTALSSLAVALNQPIAPGHPPGSGIPVAPPGIVAELLVPTGVGADPLAPLHVPKLASPANPGDSTLSLTGTWGLAGGMRALIVGQSQPRETIVITGISGNTATVNSLQFAYAAGCRVIPYGGDLWLTYFPNGGDDATTSYPGWNRWSHAFFGTNDLVYNSGGIVAAPGGGYEIGFTCAFRSPGIVNQ